MLRIRSASLGRPVDGTYNDPTDLADPTAFTPMETWLSNAQRDRAANCLVLRKAALVQANPASQMTNADAEDDAAGGRR